MIEAEEHLDEEKNSPYGLNYEQRKDQLLRD
jgi:hypothetical protein